MVLQENNPSFLLLSLDTSGDTLSMALSCDGHMSAQKSILHHRKLSSLLPQTIEEFLKEEGVTYRDLHGICLNCGPGSFTGLRMGSSVVLGLGLPLSIPVWGVTGFQSACHELSINENLSEKTTVVIIPDGNTNWYYRQSLNGFLEPEGPFLEPSYVDERTLLKEVPTASDLSLTWIIPSGLKNIWGAQRAGGEMKDYLLPKDYSGAPAIALAGWRLYTLGRLSDPSPLYIKPCYADALLAKT